MAARVPASQLAPLSELDASGERKAKPKREPVRPGSLLALPWWLVLLPGIGFAALARRYVRLRALASRSRPTLDTPKPGSTVDIGVGAGVCELELPAVLGHHPYRDPGAPTRWFLLGDVAEGSGLLLRALALHAALSLLFMIGAAGAAAQHPGAPQAPDAKPPAATAPMMNRLAMGTAGGWLADTSRARIEYPPQPRPTTADVNGDGVPDFIVLTAERDRPQATFAVAYDGATGHELWRSESRTIAGGALPIATTTSRAFVVDSRGAVTVHELTSGRIVGATSVPASDSLCSMSNMDAIWVGSMNAGPGRVVVEDGAISGAAPRPATCTDTPGLPREEGPLDGNHAWIFEAGTRQIRLDENHATVNRDDRVISVTEDGLERWRERYFLDEDRSGGLAIRAFDFDAERAYLSYELAAGGRRIGARSLANGKLVWTTTSLTQPGALVRAMAASDGRVLLVTSNHLELMDAETGKRLWLALQADPDPPVR